VTLSSKSKPLLAIPALIVVGVIMLFAVSLLIREVRSQFRHVYYVSPAGDDLNTGKEKGKPLATIQKALNLAKPGDTVELADGEYQENIQSVRNGKKSAPITLKGSREARLTGNDRYNRIVEIKHDYIHLEDFHIDGHVGSTSTKKDYRDKLVYVQGTEEHKGVTGLKISGMLIENAGGECIRLRYFATKNEIVDNTIRSCGAYDFVLADGGKNGEAIYIGTAPEQRDDGRNPTTDPDMSKHNWVHHNTIETNGNECVDIKEGATENIVEYNTCSNQLDPESAGLDSRGNHNIFRYNTVRDTVGAAVRLGGDDEEEDGIENDVYGNKFINNQGGAIKVMREPQGNICENTVEREGGADTRDEETTSVDPTAACDA
jgi:hypothetical protein